MLNVAEADEPDDFDARVRKPGRAYLKTLSVVDKPDWTAYNYWSRCKDQLRSVYGGICAFTATYVAPVTGSETVEHFKDKNSNRSLAYEWKNYRFVCGRMNGRKGTRKVVDPFKIPTDLFFIDLPSMFLTINPAHKDKWGKIGNETIAVLSLNDDRCSDDRAYWLRHYADGNINKHYLLSHAPFIAREVERLKLTPKKLKVIVSQSPIRPIA